MKVSEYLENTTIISGIIALLTTDNIIAYLTIISISLAIIIKLCNFLKTFIPKLKTMLKDKKLDKGEIKEITTDIKTFIKDTTNEIRQDKEINKDE